MGEKGEKWGEKPQPGKICHESFPLMETGLRCRDRCVMADPQDSSVLFKTSGETRPKLPSTQEMSYQPLAWAKQTRLLKPEEEKAERGP